MITARHQTSTAATQRKGVTFLDYIERSIKELTLSRKFGTARNYTKARNSFRTFLDGGDISLRALDEATIQEYDDWLRKRGIVRNTVSFYMRILRSVYNKAVKDRLARQASPFSNVYTGIDKTRKKALNERSIGRLLKLDLKGFPGLSLSRDLFIFSFFTRGMSFVDIAFLRKRDINGKYISYHRQKTGHQLTILMEPCIAAIIKRYAEKTKGSPYIFPILSSSDKQTAYRQYQTALGYHNRKLKTLAELAGLNIPLSSYCARHSWATVARNHSIPVSVISEALGHTSEKMTLIYLDSLETSVIDKANHQVLESVLKTVSL